MRNGQRAMTKRKKKKQQPEEMKWSLKEPNIKKVWLENCGNNHKRRDMVKSSHV
jgi:hypothetical protein